MIFFATSRLGAKKKGAKVNATALSAICHTPCAKKRLQSVAHVVTMMMEDPSLRTAQETQQTLTEVLLSKAAVLNVSKV